MHSQKLFVLTINAGSSSIKFALFQADLRLKRILSGTIERIGTDNKSAANLLIASLEKRIDFSSIKSVGHRIVFGMKHSEPERVTPRLLRELRRFVPLDSEHLPLEIELIDVFRRRHPKLLQFACFDTAFHRTMPMVARLLPIPRRFYKRGIQRYGFHGLSYSYLMQELARIAGVKAARGRVILAHLGNGASLAAVLDGKSIDTSMGFTPTGGILMGTRSGDLDPGVVTMIMKADRFSPKQLDQLVNHESGLLGISETSSDVRDLIERQRSDIRAREAIDLFCYRVKKWIGSFAASLGGVDTLIFSGGIGENSSEVRARICSGLDFLGIGLDPKLNKNGAPIISQKKSGTVVRVIRTDEEVYIADLVLKYRRKQEKI